MPTTIVTDQPIVYEFVATNGQDTFECDCQLFNDRDDLIVSVNDIVTGDYTLNLLGDEGFEVVLDDPCVVDDEVTIERRLVVERVSQFPNSGGLAMEVLNHELNRIVALIQQLGISSYATITINEVEDLAPGETPYVTNVGTSEEAILNFGLVRGANGSLGAWGGLTGDINDQTDLATALGLKAALASPALTGTPTAPTAALGTDTTQLATTAFVMAQLNEGTYELPIMASAITRRTTGGAAAGTTETGTSKICYTTIDFDSATDEFAQVQLPFGASYNRGTIRVQFGWMNSGGTPGQNVIWTVEGVAISNDDLLDATFGTPQSVTDTLIATTDLHISSYTAALTLGGTPADADLLVLQFSRDANNGSDNLVGDAKLVFVRIEFSVDAKDDN